MDNQQCKNSDIHAAHSAISLVNGMGHSILILLLKISLK